jgi:hypothetical protein
MEGSIQRDTKINILVSHWYSNQFDVRKWLISPRTEVYAREMLVPHTAYLTGINMSPIPRVADSTLP